MRISVTTLSSHLYCKRKLFLERVLGLVEPEKLELVKGSIRHSTYDEINKVEEAIIRGITENDSIESIYSKYAVYYSALLRKSINANKYRLKNVRLPLLNAYNDIWPFFKRESEIRALSLWQFIEKNKVYGKELWEKLTPKIESEYRIDSENLMLRGIIDKIEKYETGIVPVELKTGSMPAEGVWPGHRIQVAAYAMMMEEKFKTEIKEGFVHYLDTNTRRQIVINPFIKDEVKELRKKVAELLSGKEIPEPESENKCAKCGLSGKCLNKEFINSLIQSKFPVS